MADGVIAIDEPTTEYPPRYWWLRRIGLAYVVGLAVLVVAWLLWSWDGSRRLANLIDDLHVKQQPVVFADFARPQAVPPGVNAATVLGPALSSMFTSAQLDVQVEYGATKPPSPTVEAEVRRFLTSQAATLAAVRQARRFQQLDWAGYATTTTPYPAEYGGYYLTQLLTQATLVNQWDSHPDASIETLRDLLHLAQLFDRDDVLDTSYRYSETLSMADTAVSLIIFHDLVNLQSAGATVSHPPSDQQVAALIHELQDETALIHAIKRGWQADRAGGIAAAQSPGSNGRAWPVWDMSRDLGDLYLNLLQPALKVQAAKRARQCTQMIEAIESSDFAKAQNAFPDKVVAPQTSDPRKDTSPLLASGRLLPYMRFSYVSQGTNLAWGYARYLAVRRAATVKLAIEWYQRDHGGMGPATLDELVPKYLSAVPIDPSSPDHSKMQLVIRNTGGKAPGAFVTCAYLMYGWELNLPAAQFPGGTAAATRSSSPSTLPANTPN